MESDEVDFCKECGMEFPNGREVFCTLCGFGVCPKCGQGGLSEDDEECPTCGRDLSSQELGEASEFEAEDPTDDVLEMAELCSKCRRWCSVEDWHLQFFWFGFDNPSWLTLDERQCSVCIRNAISDDYPKFKESGLEPEIYLIYEDAKEMGIDLGPKLYEIEMTNAVERLHNNFQFRYEIVDWLASDVPLEEAVLWVNLFASFADAMEWKKLGFRPDVDPIEEWIEWGCSPSKASDFVRRGVEAPPGVGYKQLGIGLVDAAFYDSNGFSSEEDSPAETSIATWLASGLSSKEIVDLRNEVFARQHFFEELHDQLLENETNSDVPSLFWDHLPWQFQELRALGLPISTKHLESYWGLTRDEILQVIDSGAPLGTSAELVRRGISTQKMGTYEKLLKIGASQSLAISLVSHGFSVRHLQEFRSSADESITLERLGEIIRRNGDFTIDEAIPWLNFEGHLHQIAVWHLEGFTAQDAGRWSSEGFDVEGARRWSDAGVISPVIAKRRQDAGLEP